MTTPRPAASYARISEKQERDKVADQHAQNRRHAGARGYVIVAEFTDDGISALGHRVRPDFERMLIAAERGEFEVIVATEEERLARNVEEKLELHAACEAAGVVWDTVRDGFVDPSTDSGEFMSTVRAAMGRIESKRKARRQVASNIELVADGFPVPGKRRFGFEPGNRTERPEEAERVRWAFDTIARGGAVYAVAQELGIRPARVREILTNPAYAGWVTRHGERFEAHESVARIVDRALWEDVQNILADPARKTTPGPQRRYLASGIAVCAVCGEGLISMTQYACPNPARHVYIQRAELDRRITDRVWIELEKLASEPQPDTDTAEARALRAERATLTEQRIRAQQIATLDGADVVALQRDLKSISTRLGQIEERLADIAIEGSRTAVIDIARAHGLFMTEIAEAERPMHPGEIADAMALRTAWYKAWAATPLEEQRALAASLLDIRVHSARIAAKPGRTEIRPHPNGKLGHVEFVKVTPDREGPPRVEITPKRRQNPA